MPRKPHRSDDDTYEEGGDGEECPVCRQEYSNGICPIRSSECPYQQEDTEEDEDFADEEAEEEEASDDEN